jgi:uncharacterized membrane protein YphA (DoxX/SURF4 family)
MKNILSSKYFLLTIRIFLAFIFIYAGIQKITDLSAFSDSISNYKLLPFSLVNIFAILMPWIELVSGLLLLFGIAVKENSFIISGMLVVFLFAIGISLVRGLNIECGCFGTTSGSKIGLIKLGENVILFLISLLLIKNGSDVLSFQKENR